MTLRPLTMRPSALASLVFCALFLFACADPVTDAEFQAARGELEQAEATLGDAEGKRARALRRRIEELRQERVDTEEELERLVSLAADGELQKAKYELRELTNTVQDAKAKARVEQVWSDLSDLAAAEVTRRASAGNETPSRGSTQLPFDPEDDQAEREVALVRSMLNRIVGNVEKTMDERHWVRARSLINMAIASSGSETAQLEELMKELESRGRAEMEQLIADARLIENDRGIEASYDMLAAQAGRFPTSGKLARYHEVMRELAAKASPKEPVAQVRKPKPKPEPKKPPVAVATPPREPGLRRPSVPKEVRDQERERERETDDNATLGADEGATELVIRATELLEKDELVAARDAWNEAADAFPRGRQRSRAGWMAKNIEARLALRNEIAATFETRLEFFNLIDVEAIDASSVVVGGQRTSWRELDEELFDRLVLLTKLTDQARIGWIQERWLRGHADALDELAAALARDEIEADQAFSILAEAREELVPDEGYEFIAGTWIDRGAERRKALAAELTRLRKKLTMASPETRDERFAALVEKGEEGREALVTALEKRWESALTALQRGSTLEQIQKVADQRDLLDGRRQEALQLIFDEQEYFYPYRPPECPPEKARLYPEVQQRVNALVSKVRDVWDSPKKASLPKKFTAAVEELAWNRLRQGELALAFDAPDFPRWLPGIDDTLDEVDLHSFAWDAEERAARDYDRSILAFNEHNWENYRAEAGDESSEPETGEQNQVSITNAYRLMMGRRALAWNPRLQAACQGHSDWMSQTGKFSHFNDEDPTRTTPGDRMSLEGYNSGISENLHRGGAGPEGAHYGWTQSSGHHRNLLMPGHREMASAIAGEFWTQNFGVGRGFLEELKEWYD